MNFLSLKDPKNLLEKVTWNNEYLNFHFFKRWIERYNVHLVDNQITLSFCREDVRFETDKDIDENVCFVTFSLEDDEKSFNFRRFYRDDWGSILKFHFFRRQAKEEQVLFSNRASNE